MQPVKKQKLSSLAVNAIISLIEEQKLGVGDRLPSEPKLAILLEISRPSVREAIRIMEMAGRLRVEQGKGIFVQDPSGAALFSPFKKWLTNHKELLKEHFEVRLLIEPHAAARAAERRSENDRLRFKPVLKEFRYAVKNKDIEAQIQADEEFHRMIAHVSGNRTIYELMKTFTAELHEGWISTLHTPGRSEASITEHCAVFDAIEAGDPEAAAQAMTNHLARAIKDLGLKLGEKKLCSE
ncbi:MAG: FCD domain-containing protein [Spirochaetales bacterium]|jgi:GntR family transcriptional repressor for pyruvate dehydrogenase complex|nr:FCD domain-containing protein [Spirochaetales bacterium]